MPGTTVLEKKHQIIISNSFFAFLVPVTGLFLFFNYHSLSSEYRNVPDKLVNLAAC